MEIAFPQFLDVLVDGILDEGLYLLRKVTRHKSYFMI